MSEDDERFQVSLPRTGGDLTIAEVRSDGSVIITDGVRHGYYAPQDGQQALEGQPRLVPSSTESGNFGEAVRVTLTDGQREVAYTPFSADYSPQNAPAV
ncbi:hypothetical protein DUT91_07745 [Phyllobacterium salinisoli]|uniref:Uncharacterized protein n=1 Tax=Phyllobacterium salinisoli TaxID=1899321 RepID=A0A368K488_9HYPH|nr:hypothetical protein [Phyllobacterium salinisoli]RCS24198.1 hypothetical protein DUT91_07745 [Phyllobacterium salinisoli]